MYIIENKNNNYKLADDKLTTIDGFHFSTNKKVHKIKGQEITKLVIYNKKIANSIVKKQVDKKYKKLISLLTELLISDDDTGRSQLEALTEIEKFRQIIKNKYRQYLTKKDLESMSKQLSIIQKNAKDKIIELQNSLLEKEISKGRNSAK